MGMSRGPLGVVRSAWRALAPEALRVALGRVSGPLYSRLALAGARADALPHGVSDGPIVISSLFDSTIGVARAAQFSADAFERAGLAVERHDLNRALALDAAGGLPGDPRGVWIVNCNAPEARVLLARTPRDAWRDRYRIAYWNWELLAPPEEWRSTARLFHEIWAPSVFSAEAFKSFGVPVRVAPLPIAEPRVAPGAGADLPLEAGVVHVLAMADLGSVMARKNPLGAVALFRRLFPEPQSKARLVLKISGAAKDPEGLARIRDATAGRPDIVLILARLSDEAMAALSAACDIFLSLHRSEGFGLAIAEAMAAGRPALATGWSGNMDFMAGLPELCVGYTLTPVGEDVPVYGGYGARWAEPDLEDAAGKLKALIDDPALRAGLGERARREIEALNAAWTPEAVQARLPPRATP